MCLTCETIALLEIAVYKEIFSVQSMSKTNNIFLLFFVFDMFMTCGTTMLLKMEVNDKMLIVQSNAFENALLSPVFLSEFAKKQEEQQPASQERRAN